MHAPRTPSAFLALLSSLAACSAPARPSLGPEHAAPRPLPTLEDALRVVEAGTGEELEFAALLDRLSAADVVFLGETHLDDTTHRVEAAVLEGLLERCAGQVVLSLEMFERDVQPVLDDYLAGRIDESAFLAAARPWGNYRTDYRPLIETARRHGIPVVAANAPAALRRKVSAGGRAVLEALAPEERRLFPAEILPASDSYWQRVDRATRGHMNFASLAEEQRLYSGQNLWDNSMGDACAQALAAHPGRTILHVVGGFHVHSRDGTAAQLARRAPGARVAVVEIAPVAGLFTPRPERERERESADYLVYAAELARSVSDGQFAVSIAGEVRYSIDVPPSATEESRAPLVVWLPDASERPADARAFLVAALGEEAAIAVVEPPLSESADDLAPGGRWASAANFRADQGRVQQALERLVEYVTRRLPVSNQRVVIAGRGLGATSVLWSAMYTEWLDACFVAVAPRGAGALRMEGLPDRAPLTRALCLLVEVGSAEDLAWIEGDYRAVGTPTELATLAPDVAVARQIEGALREALALAPRAPESPDPILCAIERELPRARQWAETFARREEHAGRSARVVTTEELTGDEDSARVRELRVGGPWSRASLAEGRGIPLAEGDFGGTTVLVVPAGAEASEREAWLELERTKALRKRSPFAGLRVALEDGAPSLAQVLGTLRAEGSRSVLVVPATFCASPLEMRALWNSIQGPETDWSDLDLAWLPGLGGELCGLDSEE